MEAVYYGELDALFGSVPPDPVALPWLVGDLEMLLEEFERVIVPRHALLEHPLTLPAFEVLAPYVAAGRLGTWGVAGGPGPYAFLEQRAWSWANVWFPPLSVRRKAGRGRWRREELADVLGRWRAVLPAHWVAVRSGPLCWAQCGARLREQAVDALAGAARRGAALRALHEAVPPGRSFGGRAHLLASLVRVGRRRAFPAWTEVLGAAYEAWLEGLLEGLGTVLRFPGRMARRMRGRSGGRRVAWRLAARSRRVGAVADRAAPARTLLPSPWSLLVRAEAGTAASAEAPVGADVGSAQAGAGPVRLSPLAGRLVSLLVAAGPVGVAVDEVEALLRELDVADGVRSLPAVLDGPQAGARDRVDVALHRLNGALAKVRWRVVGARGRWRLVAEVAAGALGEGELISTVGSLS